MFSLDYRARTRGRAVALHVVITLRTTGPLVIDDARPAAFAAHSPRRVAAAARPRQKVPLVIRARFTPAASASPTRRGTGRAARAALPVAALGITAVFALAACAGGGAQADERPGGASAAPAAAAAPFTATNCGFAVTLDTPPARIVTIKSTSADMVAALGMADRIVGAAFLDGPLDAELFAETEPPIMEGKLPSQEAVLALRPDLVFAGWESNFSADGAGDRAELAGLGIASYVSPAACRTADVPGALTFEALFDEIAQAGRLLGAQDAADDVIAGQRAMLESLTPSTAGLSAAWYSSGRETPYMGAGTGAPQMMMEALGLRNVFGDITETWVSVGWEKVIEQAPDVIVLVESPGNTIEAKIELMKADPVLSKLPAVEHDRFLRIDFAAAEAGVRTVPAAVDLAAQLRALGFEG